MLDYGDLVLVWHEGEKCVRPIMEIGRTPPNLNHVMVAGIHYWFHATECVKINEEETSDSRA